MELTLSEYLEKAWSYIDEPDKWHQGTLHADANGNPLYGGGAGAARHCSIGALDMALPVLPDFTEVDKRNAITSLEDKAYKVLRDCLPKSFRRGIAQYNDTKKYKTVREWWMRAIEKARSEQSV